MTSRAPAHRPIMLAEVLRFLRPAPGDTALDCTIGGGGHARAILERIQPGGRLIGIDVDRIELAHTTDTLRAEGYGSESFTAHHGSFSDVRRILRELGVPGVDIVLADLGVSSMQAGNASRGFHYKVPGPLDMRMNGETGETAADLIARLSEAELELILRDNADEPHAGVIAELLKRGQITTTQTLERTVRLGLSSAIPTLTKPQLKMSVRRTFQALRIAVNGELTALDALLADLPTILSPGGRAVFLTFHSGEDRRVKQAFRAGFRRGAYSEIARTVTKSVTEETRANRRASSAKLRWAVGQRAIEN